MRMPAAHLLFAVFLALTLTACRDQDGLGPNAPPAPFVSSSKTQSVNSAGGTLTLTDARGAIYTLQLPPGAVAGAINLGLTTVEPEPGQLLALRLTPAGTVLAVPARLRVVLPAGVRAGPASGVRYGGGILPLTRNADGSLEILIPALLGAGPLTAKATPSQPVLSVQQALDLDQATTAAEDAFNAYALSGLDQDALVAIIALDTIEGMTQFSNYEQIVTPMVRSLTNVACGRYENAVENIPNNEVETYSDARLQLAPMIFFRQILQRLEVLSPIDMTCTLLDNQDHQGLINDKYAEVDGFLGEHEDDLDETGSADYQQLKQETVASQDHGYVVAAAGDQTATAAMEQTLLPKLYEGLLAAPRRDCRDDSNYGAYFDLLDDLAPTSCEGIQQRIQQDAQYCASLARINIRNNEGALSVVSSDIGGQPQGQPLTRTTVNGVPTRGKISFSGSLEPLQCPSGRDDATLYVIYFDGEKVGEVSPASITAGTFELDIATIIQAADIEIEGESQSEAAVSQADLRVVRQSNACNGYWGSNPETLLTYTLDFGNKCKPAEGFNFCITPVLDGAGQPVAGIPVALNARGSLLMSNGGNFDDNTLWRGSRIDSVPFQVFLFGRSSVMNDSDQVAVTACSGNNCFAGVWSNGQVTELPNGPVGGVLAAGINNRGDVVGQVIAADTTRGKCENNETVEYQENYIRAAVWPAGGGGPTLLGAFDDGDPEIAESTIALSINTAGQAVGRRENIYACRAFNAPDRSFLFPVQFNGTVETTLATPVAGVATTALVIDDLGSVLLIEISGTSGNLRIPGSSVTPVGLGPMGDTFDLASNSIVNIHTGATRALGSSTLPEALGWNLANIVVTGTIFGRDGIAFDRLGRMAGIAPRNGVNTPFILTPRGVKLPPQAAPAPTP